MPTAWERDLAAARANLSRWLRGKLPNATELETSQLTAPQSSGFSNETLLFDLAWTEAGRHRKESLVVRIQPTGFAVFPEYDMKLQYDCMRLLAPTGVPVPRMVWLETDDTSVVGAPFYVMGRIEGRVPSDRPPYTADGWLKELAPAAQARVWWGGIESMAKIHTLDWRALGFGFVDRPELGRTGLEQQMAFYERYLRWAARGKPQPTVEAAWEWLGKNKPVDEPDCLVWGDARIGNMMFDENFDVVAVMDWEQPSLGGALQDLSWFLVLSETMHGRNAQQGTFLEGMGTREETIALWEQVSGKSAADIEWYEDFTHLKMSCTGVPIASRSVPPSTSGPMAYCLTVSVPGNCVLAICELFC
jgi:aminoglycoside phosphotransferase (APT) family kinase protein